MPFFSIITATRNAEDVIDNLIKSLASQTFQNFEWIIADGDSSDNTLSKIEHSGIKNAKIVSRSDLGIYDAFNKSVDTVNGKYIVFIGADDYLYSNSILEEVERLISSQISSTVDPLVLGRVKIGNSDLFFKSVISIKTLFINSVHHQGVFYPKVLFSRFRYDNSSKIVADYELNLILYLKKMKFIQIENIICVCGQNGVSNNSNQFSNYLVMHKIRRKYLNYFLSYIFFLLGIANVFFRG
jgi:glycosyltransferase involved in cell wall biosynthesis